MCVCSATKEGVNFAAFALRYLNSFAKEYMISTNVESPKEMGHIRFYLAPKVRV